MNRRKPATLAVSVLVMLALSTSTSADNRCFKANFILQADSATVSEGELRLANVTPVVFVAESGAHTACGVTESAISFLKRWVMLDHEIHPQAIVFTNAEQHETAYRGLRFQIDIPSQASC